MTMATTPPDDLSNQRRMLAVALLMVALFCEGVDLQAINFAAPDLVRTHVISKAQMGTLLSASLMGMLVGAPLIGSLGDRFGRKAIVVWATVAYGLLSLAATLLGTFWGLTVVRFLIGMALGAVMPNAMILAAEFAPEKLRVKAASLVTVGISIGAAATGFVAAALIPDYGWRSLFLVGGIAPILIAVLLIWAIPESPLFRDAAQADVAEPRRAGNPALLFSGRLRTITPVMWLTFALLSMTLYLLSGWTPMLLGQSGLSMRSAALLTSVYHTGGVVGSFVAAFMITRSGWTTLALFLTGAVAMLLLLVFGADSTPLLATGLVAAGFCVVGAQASINGACTVVYPTKINATGVSWTLGIARLGSVCGPLVGSAAISFGMTSARQLFLVAALPFAIAALGSVWLAWRTRQVAVAG